jgi:purine nucleosidase
VPRPVIFDTDWCTDVEDVSAGRVLLHMERAGYIDVRACVINCTNAVLAGSLDAFLTAHGRTGIPIGVCVTAQADTASAGLTKLFDEWPHQVGFGGTVEDAVTLMRRTLAAAEQRVDIISIGHLGNLADLLASDGDDISSLDGTALVSAKVGTVWTMIGEWPTGSEYNANHSTWTRQAAATVASTWPRPIVFSGFSVAQHVSVGGTLFGFHNDDALAVAYVASGYTNGYGRGHGWDSLGTYIGCIGDVEDAGFTVVDTGTAAFNSSTGANTWTSNPAGLHKYVALAESKAWFERKIAELLEPDWVPTATAATNRVWDASSGAWVPQDQTKPLGVSGIVRASTASATLTTGLVMHLHAADLTDLADNATVAHWPCRMGNWPVYQTSSGSRPVFRTAVAGRPAVQSAGNKGLVTDEVVPPREFTCYALVYQPTVPSSVEMILTAHAAADYPRMWQVRVNASGAAEVVSFHTGSAATEAGPTMSATTWQVVTVRMSPTLGTMEALLDGTGSGGATSIGGVLNGGRMRMAVMYYLVSSSFSWTGSIAELRLYDRWHNDTTVAGIVTEMKA